jgi:hypothetical protein
MTENQGWVPIGVAIAATVASLIVAALAVWGDLVRARFAGRA